MPPQTRTSTMPSLVDDASHSGQSGSSRSASKTKGSTSETNSGQMLKLAGALLAFLLTGAVVAWQVLSREPDIGALSASTTVIDAESGEVVRRFPLPLDKVHPWTNPKTGRDTLYPAEPCFWDKDGSVMPEPTWVLVNDYMGKPGETKCPHCARRVVPRNPMPPGEKIDEARRKAGLLK